MPEQEFQPMGAAYAGWLAAQDSVPADGVCSGGDRLKRDHEGVERVLAIRKLKYFNPDMRRMVVKAGLPYCNCQRPRRAG